MIGSLLKTPKKSIRFCIFVLTIAYSFTSQIYSQQENITFEYFSVEQGLPSSVVPCLFQDRTGYLWLGTFYGIARYDGYSIVSYTHREGDTTSIANSIVNAICDDSEGNIWFGHSLGLDKFNPSTEKFSHYILNSERPLIDWSQHVLSLLEDKEGTLWVGTGFGLYFFNKATETFTWIKHDSIDPHSISSNAINSIYEDGSGSLWFATGDGLNKYDKELKRFIHYWYPSEEFNMGNSDNPFWLHSILEDREGIFWMGSSGGVVEFNRQSETFTKYKHDPENSESLANNNVQSICDDGLGQFWISTKDGVDIFNKKTKVFSHYKHDGSISGGLSSNDVGKILLDRSGVIWISTYGGGVNKFTPPNPLFKYYSLKDGNLSRFPQSSPVEDKKGFIWMDTAEGLLKFDPVKGTFQRLLPDKDICLIMNDVTGAIWYSIWHESLGKIDPGGQVSRFKDSNGSEFTELVSAMYISSNGNILLGTTWGNVYSLNTNSGEMILLFQEPVFIENICEDNTGLLWIGSRESGIICYDPLQKKSTYHAYNPSDSLSIGNNLVRQIRQDKAGNLWILAGRTLNKYDREARRFIRLGEKDGFPVNIYQFTEDEKGNLWLSTLTGTVKYDPHNNQFKNYVNLTGWGYKSRSGELYFLNKQGITRFHPDSLKDNPYIPQIVITSFRKFEKPYPFGKEIQLSYRENFLSFEFAGLSFVNPERNLYAYKMEGVDEDWVYAGTRRFASYPNLDPGEYVFKVKGSNNDGVWNEKGTSLAIFISPPFWNTWWAYISYIGIFIIVLYGIRRYEMNRIFYKNQVKVDKAILNEKEETEKIKSRFFANISHEFRTPLTLILGPAEKIISNASDDIIKDANIIKRNSRRLLQLINQLLDLSRLEAGKLKLEASKGNIVSFTNGVVLSFESLADSKDISLKLMPEKDYIELYFDREKMIKILTNLLSNAFKFTPGEGMITVSVKEIKNPGEVGTVEIKIKDTGIGIPQEELPKLFDRFYQVDNSYTKEHEGTGIGLALTKELVELHHGIIKVESQKADPENGKNEVTEFIVELPLGRTHLKDEDILETEIKSDISGMYIDEEKYIMPEDVQEELAGVLSDNKNIILIVEDNFEMREYIKESLGNNYIFEEAINGEQGVRIAEKIIPDLIISDLMMPKIDGNQLVKILKNDEKTSHIPIILLTAKAGQESKLEGLETGADDFLTKPFDTKELQIRIKNLIAQRKKLQEKFSKFELYPPPTEDKMLNNYDKKFMIKVGEVIEKHISEEEFNMEKFCSEVAMSRTQLHRKITALTGKSTTLYIRAVKLSKAKKMIEEKTGNISEIAYSLGFSSPAYFTRCFRSEFGYPPSEIKE